MVSRERHSRSKLHRRSQCEKTAREAEEAPADYRWNTGPCLRTDQSEKIKMHEVKTIVLDEGDQLLQPEHLSNIKNIIKTTFKDRQLLLFSATLPEKTEAEAKQLMQNPELIKISRGEAVQSDVEHIYFPSEQRDKIDLLQKLSRMEGTKAIAFVKDIGNAAVLAEKLMYKGIELGILHGDSSKRDRELAMKSFRTGRSPCCLQQMLPHGALILKE